MPNTPLELEFTINNEVTVATIAKAKMLDATNVVSFGELALEYVQAHQGLKLLVNFQNVQYMSSAGLTELLRINEAMKPQHTAVHLCGLNDDISNVFRITNLDKVFVIHATDSVEDAAAEFNATLPSETIQPGSGN